MVSEANIKLVGLASDRIVAREVLLAAVVSTLTYYQGPLVVVTNVLFVLVANVSSFFIFFCVCAPLYPHTHTKTK